MKNRFLALLAPSVLAATGLAIASSSFSPASAVSFTYDLNCVISGTVGGNTYQGSNTCANAGTSFGQLTIKDNATDSKKVDVFINLTGNYVHKIQEFSLNYDDAKFPVSGQSFQVTAGSGYSISSFQVNENKIKSAGYKGSLDFNIDPVATGPSNDGFTATISLGTYDLNAPDFNFKDSLQNIFAAVHIGNYGDNPGVSGNNSIWVGSTSYYTPPTPPPAKVPEPGTAAALGLFALGGWRFLKKR
jgi:hypothetical protein